jgi:hypothetical protein
LSGQDLNSALMGAGGDEHPGPEINFGGFDFDRGIPGNRDGSCLGIWLRREGDFMEW